MDLAVGELTRALLKAFENVCSLPIGTQRSKNPHWCGKDLSILMKDMLGSKTMSRRRVQKTQSSEANPHFKLVI